MKIRITLANEVIEREIGGEFSIEVFVGKETKYNSAIALLAPIVKIETTEQNTQPREQSQENKASEPQHREKI